VLSVVTADGSTEAGALIDGIVREGARRMPAAALGVEANAYVAELGDQRDEGPAAGGPQRLPSRTCGDHGRRTGRGQGAAGQRPTGRRGDRRARAILVEDPASLVPQVVDGLRGAAAALPLCLQGLSSGDFVPALERRRAVTAPHLVALVRAGPASRSTTSSNTPWSPPQRDTSQPTYSS
jgi:hypothetical protein